MNGTTMDWNTGVHSSSGGNSLGIEIDGEEVAYEASVTSYYESGDNLLLLTYEGAEVTFDPEAGTLGLPNRVSIHLPEAAASEIERKLENSIAKKSY